MMFGDILNNALQIVACTLPPNDFKHRLARSSTSNSLSRPAHRLSVRDRWAGVCKRRGDLLAKPAVISLRFLGRGEVGADWRMLVHELTLRASLQGSNLTIQAPRLVATLR